MKKLILLVTGILISTIAFTQEKFLTDNFTKEVKELNASMKTVGFTSVLPASYTKYDDIVAVIDTKAEGLNDYYSLDFYYNIMPVKNVPADKKVKYVIKSGSDKRSDFTSLFRVDMDVDFKLLFSLGRKTRTIRYQTVAVKIMGRKQEGMHWVNDEFVPKYIYEKISFSEIKLDLGEPEPTYTTENGLLTYKKYNTGKAFTIIIPSEDGDLEIIYEYGSKENYSKTLFSIYEIKAGEIKQEIFDMNGAAPKASKSASTEDMIKEIKLNVKKSLLKSSCFNEARSVKLEGQRLASAKISEGIYEPYMLDAGKSEKGSGGKALGTLKSIGGQFTKQNGANDKYNKFIADSESDLNWQTKKLGNLTVEVLELDLYHEDQCISNSSAESMTLKEDEKGKTQKLIVFIGIVDGRLFSGSFSKDGKEEMNEEDLKFKDFIFSTFQFNK